jgi:hypothetical protein
VTNAESGFTGWVLAGVGAVISTLLSGLIALFRIRETEITRNISKLELSLEETMKKADKCEEDRTHLFGTCEVLKYKVETLEQKVSKL